MLPFGLFLDMQHGISNGSNVTPYSMWYKFRQGISVRLTRLVSKRSVLPMSDQHDHHGPTSAYTQRQLSRVENKAREVQAKALESILEEDGLVTPADLDAVLDTYENDIGPLNGAKVVARAWVDPAYKERLLRNGAEAIAELGFGGLQGEQLTVVENTPGVHNAVVCTLCSCYPWPVLGLPPFWYKSPAYRSRIGGRPREVLSEFGLEIAPEREILVWNSTAQTRYLVLPQRPAGTQEMSEDELARLVTRDTMIGVAEVRRDTQTRGRALPLPWQWPCVSGTTTPGRSSSSG